MNNDILATTFTTIQLNSTADGLARRVVTRLWQLILDLHYVATPPCTSPLSVFLLYNASCSASSEARLERRSQGSIVSTQNVWHTTESPSCQNDPSDIHAKEDSEKVEQADHQLATTQTRRKFQSQTY